MEHASHTKQFLYTLLMIKTYGINKYGYHKYLMFNDDIYKKNYYKYGNDKESINIFSHNILKGGFKKQNYTIKYNNEIFTFENNFPNNYVLYSTDELNDCINITIDNKIANINNINSESFLCGETIITNQGSHLLKLTIKFLKKYKKTLNINCISLSDNSRKYCQDSEPILLHQFLFFLTSETWYTKYGFKYKKEYEQFLINKKIINKIKIKHLKWNNIIDILIKNNVKSKYIEIFKNVDENTLLIDFLSLFFNKQKYNKRCYIFNLIINDIVIRLIKKTEYKPITTKIMILDIK